MIEVGIGLLLLLSGLMHRVPAIARWDARTFQTLHIRLHRGIRFFRALWHLGRTPFALLALAFTFRAGWQTGLLTTIIYFATIGLERITKFTLRRPRPFAALPDILIDQPRSPKDPSHPSGDALRSWFLALVIPVIFGWPWPATLAACILAALVSLGRVALGVHYPLDVIGGMGLGLLAAGVAVISY